MKRGENWKVNWKDREMIKYSIAHENLKWNSDNNQNREIIESLLKLTFSNFLPNFGENFKIESSRYHLIMLRWNT
jgi:hypothetical protein